MDVLTKYRFDDAARLYPKDRSGLRRCLGILCMAQPGHFADLQKIFGNNVDLFKHRAAEHWVVIDVGGNHLRVIGGVNYSRQKFYVKHIFNHADYDEANSWYASNKRGIKP